MQNSNNSTRYCLLVLWFLLMTVILTSCTMLPSNPIETSKTIESTVETTTAIGISPLATLAPSKTPIATVTVTSSPSMTPSVTVSVTALPSKTPTVTITPVPTITPLPTIPPQQYGQLYSELMSNNGGCVLPCWWGFKLGEASLDEVHQFYTSFDTHIFEQDENDVISLLEAKFLDPQIENGTQVRHTFIAEDDVLIEAQIEIVFDPNYQITPLLQRLGQPSEIWMWTIPEPYEGILPARFYLYFPEKGVFILYGTGGRSVNDTVNICFDDYGGTILHLWVPTIWDPNYTKGFIERLNESSQRLAYKDYHSIDGVSNWDVEQFYTIISAPTHSECLETPSDLWSPP